MYSSIKLLALVLLSSQFAQAQLVPAPSLPPAPAFLHTAPALSAPLACVHPPMAPPAPHAPLPPLPPNPETDVYPAPAPEMPLVPADADLEMAPAPKPPHGHGFNQQIQEPASEKNPGIEKTRKISKNIKISKDDKLQIDNKYGKVHVNTNGSKSEIIVDITIIARGETEAEAQQILDKIKIQETKEGNLIALKTILEQVNSKNSTVTNSTNKGFEINYMVTMPKTTAVALKNSFGDMYLGELNAPADLQVSYGNLKTERLNGASNNVKIKFGNGNLLYAKQCSLDVSYSNVRLDGIEKLDLQSKFSDLTLPLIEDMIIKSKYDKLKIGKVNSMQGSTGYSDCRVDNLQNTMDMKVQYCNNFEVKNASKNFKSISLEGGYSTFNLNFDDNTNFNFNVDLHYGNLKADKDLVNFKMIEKDHASNEYQGQYGKSNPKSNVNIKAKYGDVKFVQVGN